MIQPKKTAPKKQTKAVRYCGPFIPDLDLPPHPADLEQRFVCVNCHCVGEKGDARHTRPSMPVAAGPDHGQRAAGEEVEPG